MSSSPRAAIVCYALASLVACNGSAGPFTADTRPVAHTVGDGAPAGDLTGADAALRADGAADLGPTDLPPAPDSPPPPDLPACSQQTFTGTAEADAVLVSGPASNINYGGAYAGNIGVAVGSVGIFRFDVAAIPAAAQLRSVVLRLAVAEQDGACGTGCGDCSHIEAPGTLALAYMRSDWPEPTVTWEHLAYHDPALGSVAWDQPGAQGPADRGPEVATVQHVAVQEVVFDSAGNPGMLAGLAAWRTAAGKLTLQVSPATGAVFIAAMREQPNPDCGGPGYARPQLTIRYCP